MRLLKFEHSMPCFSSIQYVSQKALDIWTPKIDMARKAYNRINTEMVLSGKQRSMAIYVTEQRLSDAVNYYKSIGMSILPVRQYESIVNSGDLMGSLSLPPDGTLYKKWLCVITKNEEDAHTWKDAYEQNDLTTIGMLLGHPPCCNDFFTTNWRLGFIDPTWQQSENSDSLMQKVVREQFMRLRKSTPWESSSMLRHIGIGIIQHVPCSHDCALTSEIAKQRIEISNKLKLDGMQELVQLLQLPIEWNASHGMAYITTPIFRIETNSVTCDSPYVVQKEGTFMPEESARGLQFPFL